MGLLERNIAGSIELNRSSTAAQPPFIGVGNSLRSNGAAIGLWPRRAMGVCECEHAHAVSVLDGTGAGSTRAANGSRDRSRLNGNQKRPGEADGRGRTKLKRGHTFVRL